MFRLNVIMADAKTKSAIENTYVGEQLLLPWIKYDGSDYAGEYPKKMAFFFTH